MVYLRVYTSTVSSKAQVTTHGSENQIGTAMLIMSYLKLILSELKINPQKLCGHTQQKLDPSQHKTAVFHIFSQAKCRWKPDIADFVSRQNEMDDFNVSTRKKDGAVPKRATRCSLLIYVNIFLLKQEKKSWKRTFFGGAELSHC